MANATPAAPAAPSIAPAIVPSINLAPPDTGATMLRRRSVHGAAATFVGQGARLVLQFGSQVMLARLLLPREFGLVAMVAPILTLVAIFTDLGLSQATIQREHVTQGQLSALFWTNVAVSAALACLVAASAPLLARFYGEPALVNVTIALAALLVITGAATQHVALMNRQMQFIRLAWMDMLSTMAAVVAGICAAWAGLGVWSLVLMQVANAVTILTIAWAGSGWRPSWPRREPELRAMLQFGGHLTGYNLINFLGANLDSVMIGKVAGPIPLGLYDRAYKLVAAPIWTISLPVARVAIAVLSRLQAAPERYSRAYLRMLQVLLLVTVPAVAFVAAAAPSLVPALLGPSWVAAAPLAALLAVATGFAPLSITAYWLFVSQGRTVEQAAYACVRACGTLVALLAGLPWGALGVACSYAVAAPLVHGLPLWGATRRGPVSRADVLAACLPFVAAGLGAALPVLLVERELQSLVPLARLGVAAFASYAGAAAVLACLPGGRALLRNLWGLRDTLRAA